VRTATTPTGPTVAAPVVLAWTDHLDALEEWLRRSRDLLETGDPALADLPPLACVPAGPLPSALALRAAVALATLDQLGQTAARRLLDLQRSSAYARY
jgi:hypothetical protein